MDNETTAAPTSAATPATTATPATSPISGRALSPHKDILIALASQYSNANGINWVAAFKAHPEWATALGVEPGEPTPQTLYQQVTDLRAAGLIARTPHGTRISATKTGDQNSRSNMSQQVKDFHAKYPEDFQFGQLTEHFGYSSLVHRWINKGVAKKKPGVGTGYTWTAKGHALAAGEVTIPRSAATPRSVPAQPRESGQGSTELMLDAIRKHRAAQFSVEEMINWTQLNRSTIYMNAARWMKQGKLTRGRGVYLVSEHLFQSNGSTHRAPVADAPQPAPAPAAAAPAAGPAINFCPCCGTDLSSLLIAANAIRQQQR